MRLDQLEFRLADWHNRKYGNKPVDLQKSLVKLLEEAGELAKAILKGDIDNAREEVADVAIICTHIARGLEASLFIQMIAKYHVLEERLRTGVKEKQ